VGRRSSDLRGSVLTPWPSNRTAYSTLFVLTIVVMFTVLDRQVLALMIEPVKADFGVSDTQVALLLGAAFSITYGIAGLPIARIADTWNRRNLVAICLAFWSAATMACGIAQSYAQLFVARLGIGIGESGYGPATWSMVTDTFPRERVAFGTATLAIGAMVGSGLALVVGGGALALVSHLPAVDVPFIGTMRSWQWAFIIVGLPGLLWTLAVLSLKEPERRGFAKGYKHKSVKVMDVARYMGDDWRTYTAVIGGTAMKYLMTLGSSQWMPTLFRREFNWELSRIGLILGTVMVISAPLGLIVGGKISERWAKRGRADANLRIMFYGLLLSVPLSVIVPLIPDPWIMLGVHAVSLFVASLGTGPGIAAFQVVTPNQMRAQVSSVSQFSTNVLAFALGPLIVALFTDYLFDDPKDLKYSMALCSAILGPLTVLLVLQGLKPYARSYERAVREFAN
jgi:MFS family permease